MTFSDFLQEIGIENIQLNSNGNFQESNIGSMGEQEVSSLCAQIAQLVNQHKTTVLKLVVCLTAPLILCLVLCLARLFLCLARYPESISCYPISLVSIRFFRRIS